MAVQTITYGDKQYLNQNADIPATNKVQDIDMNEIKSVVNNNANNIGDLTNLQTPLTDNLVNAINSRTLRKLWENPNPTNSFEAQNITLSSDDYDYLIFVCRFEGNNYLVSQFSLKGCGVLFGIGWDYNGGSGTTYYSASFRRLITYINDTSYDVGDCYVRYSNNSSNILINNNIVPLFVYGGKF